MSLTIRAKNAGPVVEFRYEMKHAGLHVLRGDQGVGKTSILRSIQWSVDGRADRKPTRRDGTKRGEVSVGNKTLVIMKQIREEGDLSVEGLGDLDLGTIHNPPYKDATTRDRHRIAGLVRAAGVQANAALFHELVGGKDQFEEIVDDDALKTDDLVEMAARVKRAIEKQAQAEERKHESALANMRALRSRIEGVDLTAPHDERELQDALQAAIERRSELRTKRSDADAVLERAAKARKELESADAGPSVSEAREKLQAAVADRNKWQDEVAELEKRLTEAKGELGRASDAVGSAEGQLAAAQRNADLTDRWRADIEAAEKVERPTDEDIQQATIACTNASNAVERGVKVRAAIEAQAEADDWSETAESRKRAARRLRDAASDVQGVLSDAIAMIPDCPLFVKLDDDGNPRLVMSTDRSDAEPIDELSDGERWEPLMQIAAGTPNRVIVLPQAAFGEMGEEMRNRIDELAREHGCYVVTAEVSHGELRAEPWSSPEPALVG